MEKKDWHASEVEDVMTALETSRQGITDEEAAKRLEIYGPNELKEEKKKQWYHLLWEQFTSILVIVLIIAAIVSGYLAIMEDEPLTDAIVILIIVVMNAILGFVQEYRAEQAVEALKAMVSPHVLVLRGGKEESIDSKDLVPGDIVLLEAGSRVPADSRLIEAANLEVDEAALTGESMPVSKRLIPVAVDAGIGDQKNMVFMGTVVTNGRAVAVVTDTGMSSQFGKIAGMVQAIDVEEPPLRRKMEKMGKQLTAISVVLTVFVFFVLWFVHDRTLKEVFMTSISLAVSAIPEGLPAVLTITLALGTAKLARQKAIVRKLASVETLGSTTVICSDKTGTLTKNEMTVTKLSTQNRHVTITGAGYVPEGTFKENDVTIDALSDPHIGLLLRIGALNNDAHIQKNNGAWVCFGDPTEGALLVAAIKSGLELAALKESYPRVAELPFDSTRKRMTTIHRTPEGRLVAYVKGAPEIIMEHSRSLQDGDAVRDITIDDLKKNQDEMDAMAADALRVLALSYKWLPDDYDLENLEVENVENHLVFVGIQGMIDPAREEVPSAINTAQQAGIRTVMVTGDHRITAVAIAKEIGILSEQTDGSVLEGIEIESMSDDELDDVIENVRVCARVSPEHKMRIAQSLKRLGHIVAMTGDGVNDAPALKAADIGIAMGIKGTDVTKEASDMVLEDDNFATIVRAIRGGREIYDNISKYIRLMLAANFDEFIEITVTAVLGLPVPFLPIHVLWVNLVTDGLPAVALSIDPADPDIMRYPPRDPKEGMLKRFWRFILFAALVDFISDFIPFFYTYINVAMNTGDWDLAATTARTVAFTSIVFFEFLLAYQCRSETKHIFQLGWKGFTANKMLFVSVMVGLILQLMILYIPFLNEIFHVVPLTPFQLFYCFAGSLTAFLIVPQRLIPKRKYVEHRIK
ncbi:MAG: cation-transporting P-type ATPase [Candidatus Bathyarchaeota archaeon]|nr:cation-transporting P-type ATPase [Candidatus Bathyarchaeota archaeon]